MTEKEIKELTDKLEAATKLIAHIEKECSKALSGDCNTKNFFLVVIRIGSLIYKWRKQNDIQ